MLHHELRDEASGRQCSLAGKAATRDVEIV
jgi:hypothetical protein